MAIGTLTTSNRFQLASTGNTNFVFGKTSGAEKVRLNVYSASGCNVDILGVLPNNFTIVLQSGVSVNEPYLDIDEGGLYEAVEVKLNTGALDAQFSARF